MFLRRKGSKYCALVGPLSGLQNKYTFVNLHCLDVSAKITLNDTALGPIHKLDLVGNVRLFRSFSTYLSSLTLAVVTLQDKIMLQKDI